MLAECPLFSVKHLGTSRYARVYNDALSGSHSDWCVMSHMRWAGGGVP